MSRAGLWDGGYEIGHVLWHEGAGKITLPKRGSFFAPIPKCGQATRRNEPWLREHTATMKRHRTGLAGCLHGTQQDGICDDKAVRAFSLVHLTLQPWCWLPQLWCSRGAEQNYAPKMNRNYPTTTAQTKPPITDSECIRDTFGRVRLCT